jgi:ankyrin repeat protein
MTLSFGISFAQQQTKTATEKLALFSENLDADDIAEISNLLEEGADVNVKDKYGATTLMMASTKGLTEIVKLLMDAGGNVNTSTPNGFTPLIVASQYGYTEIVKLFQKKVILKSSSYCWMQMQMFMPPTQHMV